MDTSCWVYFKITLISAQIFVTISFLPTMQEFIRPGSWKNLIHQSIFYLMLLTHHNWTLLNEYLGLLNKNLENKTSSKKESRLMKASSKPFNHLNHFIFNKPFPRVSNISKLAWSRNNWFEEKQWIQSIYYKFRPPI